jgi:drug/metabolite transporter (DMT)-like permease
MGVEIGVLFALAALVSWGFGDFLIQRTTRKMGDWEPLFMITLFGSIVLIPFIFDDLRAAVAMQDQSFLVLLAMSVILLIAAIIDFEAMRKGKLAIVEPIYALEVPVTAILSFALIKESIEMFQIILISLIIVGIAMVSLKSHHFRRKAWIERGVLLAAVGMIFMGAANFLVGVSSRMTSPIFANWFLNVFIAMISLFYLLSHKRIGKMAGDFRANKKLVLSMCAFDNFAWICIAFAASFIPIAIAFALSESYIALAALLGLMINREMLMRHQKLGLVVTLLAAITLSIVMI